MFLCGSKEAFEEGCLSKVTCPGRVAGETLNFGDAKLQPGDPCCLLLTAVGLPSGFKLQLGEMNPTLVPFAIVLGQQVQSATQDKAPGQCRTSAGREEPVTLACPRHQQALSARDSYVLF